jgi:hypothetical protein
MKKAGYKYSTRVGTSCQMKRSMGWSRRMTNGERYMILRLLRYQSQEGRKLQNKAAIQSIRVTIKPFIR